MCTKICLILSIIHDEWMSTTGVNSQVFYVSVFMLHDFLYVTFIVSQQCRIDLINYNERASIHEWLPSPIN